MITDKEFKQLCKDLDLEIPSIFYDSQARPYTLDENGNKKYFTPKSISITEKFEEINEKYLTDNERLCYHEFVLVGKSPVINEEWWNCKKCHISKEKWEKV